jgi:uncharacterized protein YkwD
MVKKMNKYWYLMLGLLMLFSSCASDKTEKTDDVQVNKEMERSKTRITKTENSGIKSTMRTALIDPQNINFILISSLVHEEVNRVRISNNLQELKENIILNKAANDQNNYVNKLGDLSHTQQSGSKQTLTDRIQYYGGGFQAMAENLIYEGFIIRTINGTRQEIITPSYEEMARKMVVNWMNSPGHRKNLLGPKYDRVGTAVAYNNELKAVFATQVFGKEF